MHNPTYSLSGLKRSTADLAGYQQDRAASLASIARTFFLSGNLREATRFQEISASAAEAAREALFSII